MSDHIHICISIPPKYAVSNVVGFIKGKSAISIARQFMEETKNFIGENFWHEAILYRLSDWMNRLSGRISGSKKKKRNVMNNSVC
jgi:putative transposase